MANITKLKIIFLNVNSLVSNYKRNELLNLLKEYVLDIVLLSETKLNNNYKIFYKDYKIILNNRSKLGKDGRTAIFIKRNLAYEEISFNYKKVTLENTIIKIKSSCRTNLYVVSVYGIRSYNKTFADKLNNLFTKLNLSNDNNFYVIASDFNAKHITWSNIRNNNKLIRNYFAALPYLNNGLNNHSSGLSGSRIHQKLVSK